MKKLLTILALSVVCAICAFGFAACEDNSGGNTPTHTHEYVEMVITPTCTADGYTMHVCTCKDWYRDNEIAALGHNYEWTITKQPTETEEGVKTGVCTRCGDTITQSIPASNHEHNYIITVVPATCTTNGYTLHKCACGNEYTDNEIPAFGHDYGWTTTKEPAETKQGEKQGVCTVCGDTIIQSIPTLNHQHNYIITVIEPTCTAGGYTLHKCTCGDEYITDEMVALEHNFVKSGTPTGDCALSMKQYYVCTRCNEIDAQAVNVQAPDTHNHLNEGDTCEYCGWSVYTKNGDSVLMKNSQDKLSAEFYGTGTYNFGNNLRQYYINAYLSNSVTSIGSCAFWGCSNLVSITIPDSVISIGSDAFYMCSSSTSIFYTGTASKWTQISGLGGLTGANRTLYINNEILTNIVLDNITVINGGAFRGCSSLTSITIPNSVTVIGSCAFENCSNLTTIIIPDSVTSIGNSAFRGCSNLVSITIPDSVISIEPYAFYNCDKLIETESGLNYVQNVLIGVANTSGLPQTKYSVRNGTRIIADSAFHSCGNLSSVMIPYGVTSIGDSAFYSCGNLSSIIIPDSVTSIGYEAFSHCSSLTNITLGNSIISIGDSTFYLCSSLTSIIIPDSVTSIGMYAFYFCDNLKAVYYRCDTWEKVSQINQHNLGHAAKNYIYSESEPIENGNFWHYDTDGITPVIWVKEN